MKISREDFAEMVAKGYEMNSLTSEDVERLLAVGGITVAPPPILPDVTPGDWYLFSYEQDPSIPSQVRTTIGVITVVLATSQATWVDFTSSRAGVARDLPHENNARVMAGSKKLVELNVALLRTNRQVDREYQDEVQAIIDHLRDEIGVDVSEFEGGG